MADEVMKNSPALNEVLQRSVALAGELRHQFVTPEHILHELIDTIELCMTFSSMNVPYNELQDQLASILHSYEQVPDGRSYTPMLSVQSRQLIQSAAERAYYAGKHTVEIPHFVDSLLHLQDSEANYLLLKAIDGNATEFMSQLLATCDALSAEDVSGIEDDDTEDTDMFDSSHKAKDQWKELVTCVNDQVENHNPLIGRQNELERTIQVLCRKDKNNPLHVGEPGVGKTALVYGLADRINKGEVPERLKDCRIYSMDMGTMLAGTQYRGDFEKRIKQVMEGARREGNVIIYIDEIHNLIGAGRGSDGSLDASNMLKPYLESGDIRFIGSTTYDEYKRYFASSKGIVRRFQEIDIQEPSVDDAVKILKGLQSKYEEFHHVKYTDAAIDYAVKASAKYITDRFLPDKAIDLIDEAGAYRELHPTLPHSADEGNLQTVDRDLVQKVLTKICKIDAMALKDEDNSSLKTLYNRVSAKIYGQDEAVKQVVEAVEMSKAGLQDDDKPLASLLFVGPTGVGKTEVARVLANELGVNLVRFDMSEYTEKHTVAKLIGSPAGYVGYEDGGLLTDAIRKTPNCVLLLDEIEKAHSDIYNILLQVMDYAVLTDNKGQKADFRNVILIMTSNAGAQFASQASVGFNSHTTRGEAMLAQVKKTFKPEFLNRLSATVVFHDMDKPMAEKILNKKLGELQQKLNKKNVVMSLDEDAISLLLKKGFTAEYGAREMDRVIAHELKPLLMREILFGNLVNGGNVRITSDGNALKVNV